MPFSEETLASQVAQWWRICLPMWKAWVWSLGQEDPLEKEMETYLNILARIIWWIEEAGGLQPMGCKEWDMTEHTHVKRLQRTLCFSTTWGHRKWPVVSQEESPHQEPNHADSLTLGFPFPTAMRNQYLLFKPPSIHTYNSPSWLRQLIIHSSFIQI